MVTISSIPEHREKVAKSLGVPLESIPSEPSLAYDQILEAAESGKIKGLWIVATNPFHSWIDSGRLAALREKLDFLVVQDMYHTTESALAADLVLPAAGWGEKDGCFINSERRIGTIKAVRKAPGLALSDFRIFRLIADAWGCGEMFEKWKDPQSAFQILRDLTVERPCDITGIQDYEHIDSEGGIQWPLPGFKNSKGEGETSFRGREILYARSKSHLPFFPTQPTSRPPRFGFSIFDDDRSRHFQPVAHRHSHCEIRYSKKTLPGQSLRGNLLCRRCRS